MELKKFDPKFTLDSLWEPPSHGKTNCSNYSSRLQMNPLIFVLYKQKNISFLPFHAHVIPHYSINAANANLSSRSRKMWIKLTQIRKEKPNPTIIRNHCKFASWSRFCLCWRTKLSYLKSLSTTWIVQPGFFFSNFKSWEKQWQTTFQTWEEPNLSQVERNEPRLISFIADFCRGWF